jgi:hypothetical protein
MSLPFDVYVIQNKGSGTFLDLDNGSPANGTKVQGWENLSTQQFAPNQQWLISQVSGSSGVYTLRNMSGGTFLDLTGGSSVNGTQIQCWEQNGGSNQQWNIFTAEVNGFWRIQNAGAKTVVDIDSGNPADGTKIQGWQSIGNDNNQMWSIKAVTISGQKINNALKANNFIRKEFLSFLSPNTQYLILPSAQRASLWNGLGLSPTSYRAVNGDAPAYTVKVAVSQWGNGRLLVDGFPYLFGIILGNNNANPFARNWYLSDDGNQIVFFNPVDGTENSNPGMVVTSGVY